MICAVNQTFQASIFSPGLDTSHDTSRSRTFITSASCINYLSSNTIYRRLGHMTLTSIRYGYFSRSALSTRACRQQRYKATVPVSRLNVSMMTQKIIMSELGSKANGRRRGARGLHDMPNIAIAACVQIPSSCRVHTHTQIAVAGATQCCCQRDLIEQRGTLSRSA